VEKYVLREAARGVVPQRMAERPKQPYRAPDSASFFGAAQPPYVEQLLSRSSVAAEGLFDPGAIEKLATKGRNGRASGFRDNAALTGILSTGLWLKEFGSNAEAANRIETFSRQKVA
jgi:asparagine synthase (glutamine-hydrolysing)